MIIRLIVGEKSVLYYVDETFDPNNCLYNCDNCSRKKNISKLTSTEDKMSLGIG